MTDDLVSGVLRTIVEQYQEALADAEDEHVLGGASWAAALRVAVEALAEGLGVSDE